MLSKVTLRAVRLKFVDLPRLFFGPRNRGSRLPEFAMLIAWAAAVGIQIFHHIMFRDEVRAFSLAMAGDTYSAMIRTMHGEGHPALWYLLLRAAHAIFDSVLVLPGLAFVTAAIAVMLLIFRSPFPRALVVILIGSHCFLYEYSVMARNYGISAVLLFAIAMYYREWRDRGILLGILLFLLANTNVIATIMTGAFLLFWLLDLVETVPLQWNRQFSTFFLNAAIATLGVIICGVTILPTFNDAAVVDGPANSLAFVAITALTNPGNSTPGTLFFHVMPSLLASLVLFGATFGLLPRRAACISALAGLVVFSLFTSLASAGGARHAMVWFCFCISLYWICWKDVVESFSGFVRLRWRAFFYFGCAMFVAMAFVQLYLGLINFGGALADGRVESRSADLGRLINSRPDLAKAVIVAEPEYMAEALPFYVDNPTYLIREHGFGNYVRFSKKGQLDTNLGETLEVSRALRDRTGLPIIIIMQHKLKSMVPGTVYPEGYNWTFQASAQQIADFQSATTLLAEYGPTKYSETYDVYLLAGDKT